MFVTPTKLGVEQSLALSLSLSLCLSLSLSLSLLDFPLFNIKESNDVFRIFSRDWELRSLYWQQWSMPIFCFYFLKISLGNVEKYFSVHKKK